MVDHHVDRPDVEAQQCVQLTGTNRSCELDRLSSSMRNASRVTIERKTKTACGARSSGQARGLRVRFANACLQPPSLAGLVVLAGSLYPIPSRTRPLNSPAPMVLSLKAWKSRSLPGLPRTDKPRHDDRLRQSPPRQTRGGLSYFKAQLLRLADGQANLRTEAECKGDWIAAGFEGIIPATSAFQ